MVTKWGGSLPLYPQVRFSRCSAYYLRTRMNISYTYFLVPLILDTLFGVDAFNGLF